MNILDLYNQFDALVGNEGYDKTHSYQLMTQVKNLLEVELKMKILECVDTSKVANVGDTYLTMKTLPTDWRQTVKISVGKLPYYGVPFRRREQLASTPRRYYIDVKNKQYALTGHVASSQTINHWYLCKTPDITEADEQTDSDDLILWPAEFHPILPYKMAEIYQSNIDADAIAFRMSDGQRNQYEALKDALIAWDQDMKLQDMNYQGGYADEYEDGETSFDVGSM